MHGHVKQAEADGNVISFAGLLGLQVWLYEVFAVSGI